MPLPHVAKSDSHGANSMFCSYFEFRSLFSFASESHCRFVLCVDFKLCVCCSNVNNFVTQVIVSPSILCLLGWCFCNDSIVLTKEF